MGAYAVRYCLTFLVSAIAVLYARGGFDLVLWATAAAALAFVVACTMIALLVGGVEKRRVLASAE